VHKFWGLVFGVVMLAALGLFAVAPLVPGWWLPRNVASYGGEVDFLFYLILAITGFFFVLTEAILVWNIFQYPAREGRKSPFVHGSHRLEVLWTLVPGVILFLLALVQVPGWLYIKDRMPVPDQTVQQVGVIAHQWQWTFRYPSPQRMASWERDPELARDFGRSPHLDDIYVENELHLWTNNKVLVHLSTRDVLHSLFIPNLRVKQDALPGKTIPVWFDAIDHNTELIRHPRTGREMWVEIGYDPETGEFKQPDMIWEVACAEYCGTRHSLMRGKVYVHPSKSDFLKWLRHAQAEQQQRTARPAEPKN
jgi:cytochrome c oxidase subunit 2